MAGHSKWNNIKNRKGAADTKRAKIFGQMAKLIRIAVKEGKSPDPRFNAQLRNVLEKARGVNMPKDKIEKAIEKGMGKSASGAAIQEILYEGFGPGGIAMIMVVHTDNPNRTSSEVKFVMSRNGGNLGGPGSAQYMFQRSTNGDFVATMPMEMSEDDREQMKALIDALQELEDIEEVYIATQSLDDAEAGEDL